MKVHELKSWPESFEPVVEGAKRAELRADDRGGFEVGDVLLLREWMPDIEDEGPNRAPGAYTGETQLVRLTHVEPGGSFAIPEGYALLSFERVRLQGLGR